MMGEEILGGMAEYVRVPAENLIRIPANVDFATAAAVPIAYGTAIRMFFEIGQIKPSDTILILRASGGDRIACLERTHLSGAHVIDAARCDGQGERPPCIGE